MLNLDVTKYLIPGRHERAARLGRHHPRDLGVSVGVSEQPEAGARHGRGQGAPRTPCPCLQIARHVEFLNFDIDNNTHMSDVMVDLDFKDN